MGTIKQQNSYSLRPVWDELLDIYQVFADICHKNGLRHFVAFGTMLGAIRHHGFIPWDDDFDVLMPREDYEKFFRIANKELPPYLRTITYSDCNEYFHPFGKVIECRKEVLDRVEQQSNLPLNQGLYIDIFALDGCPDTVFSRVWFRIKGVLIASLYRYLFWNFRTQTFKGKIAFLIGWCVSVVLPKIKTHRDLNAYIDSTLCKFTNTELCGRFYEIIGRYECLAHRDGLNRIQMVPFDRIEVPVPENYDEYLKSSFGEYMKLPPEDKRVPSHANTDVAKWKFGLVNAVEPEK